MNSNQLPPRSDWNGTGTAADENSVCGLPLNSVQKLGLIQPVIERSWELSSSDQVRANLAPMRAATGIGVAELDRGRGIAAVAQADILIDDLRLRLDDDAATEFDWVSSL